MKIEHCRNCGALGHREDVCPTPKQRRSPGCDQVEPPDDHSCTPQCKVCGKAHLTADKTCKARFRTPYLVKKRYSDAKGAAEANASQTPISQTPPQHRSRFTTRKPQAPQLTSESFPVLQPAAPKQPSTPHKPKARSRSWTGTRLPPPPVPPRPPAQAPGRCTNERVGEVNRRNAVGDGRGRELLYPRVPKLGPQPQASGLPLNRPPSTA
ncbi:uncharacterized protein LOC144124605 [Amblyomma americanum]